MIHEESMGQVVALLQRLFEMCFEIGRKVELIPRGTYNLTKCLLIKFLIQLIDFTNSNTRCFGSKQSNGQV